MLQEFTKIPASEEAGYKTSDHKTSLDGPAAVARVFRPGDFLPH
jgi:hypothetical protein